MLHLLNILTGKEKEMAPPPVSDRYRKSFELFRSLIDEQGLIQLILVLARAKPAARVSVKQQLSQELQNILSLAGLFPCPSQFYVKSFGLRGAGYTYSKTRKRLKGYDDIYIYFSYDRKISEKLRDSEAREDEGEFGKLLGYPECCIKHYNRQKFVKPGDYSLSCFKRPALKPWPYLNNALLWVYGLKIIDHFPCRPDCIRSLRINRRYLKVLEKCDPRYADFLKTQLKSLVLCSRAGEVIYSTKYRKTDRGLVVEEIRGDRRDPLYELVKKKGSLRIVSPHTYEIGDRKLFWPEVEAAIFE